MAPAQQGKGKLLSLCFPCSLVYSVVSVGMMAVVMANATQRSTTFVPVWPIRPSPINLISTGTLPTRRSQESFLLHPTGSRISGRVPLLNYPPRRLEIWMCVHTAIPLAATTDWGPVPLDSALSNSRGKPLTKMPSRTMWKRTGNTRILWITSCSLSNVTSCVPPVSDPNS